MNTVLFIGSVWPEPWSSASGNHSYGILNSFEPTSWNRFACSPAKANEAFKKLSLHGWTCTEQLPNDPAFDEYVRCLNPDVVIFDRLIMEEQFSWRVRAQCPRARRVLDTQDLHFRRKRREQIIANGAPLEESVRCPIDSSDPNQNIMLLRELSSCHRSDAVIAISDVEHDILVQLGVPEKKIHQCTFFYSPPSLSKAYAQRQHFITLGNFRHKPNWDALTWLQKELWPEIRRRLPEAELHAFGAYPSKEAMALTDASVGFHVRGAVENAIHTMEQYRVCLAPLRIGAGIKGKIADAWSSGTPVVTTEIGAEGMRVQGSFAGHIGLDSIDFIESACALYKDEQKWLKIQSQGLNSLMHLCDASTQTLRFQRFVNDCSLDQEMMRKSDVFQSLFWQQTLRSTEYFSRWIEIKNQTSVDSVHERHHNTTL